MSQEKPRKYLYSISNKLRFVLSIAFITCQVSLLAQTSLDTATINKINKDGFNLRQTDPDKTLQFGKQALKLSKKLGYKPGMAESYRVMGVGYSYLGKLEESINAFLNALALFESLKDVSGQAKAYNNIGTLYIDNDYDEAIRFFRKALGLAKQLKNNKLVAGIHMNMASVQVKKKRYRAALNNYQAAYHLFNQIDQIVAIKVLGNIGVTYYEKKDYKNARQYLLEAVKKAKKERLYSVVASTDQTLIEMAMAQNKPEEAQWYLAEGRQYAKMAKSEKLIYDYLHTSYEVELKRKNYPAALAYLQQVVKSDSLSFKNNVSDKMSLIHVQYRQREREKQDELIIERQKKDRVLFGASTLVAGLLLGTTFLLINNVRRTAKSNIELTRLNTEVNTRKDELDSINQHLEEMIDDRTHEIQIKNEKLERFSLHLSHQIRGPVATLKGLMILEQENMIDKFECFEKMRKCIYDIDDQILNISTVLEDQNKVFQDTGLKSAHENTMPTPRL